MMVSPFTFYRGAALPMASDLSHTPVSGLAVQACGDAHLSNFGLFGSAERRLVFDVNDFDETAPGPWEMDIKRLATSLEVAARGNGFSSKERREIVTAAVASYRQAMRTFAGMTNLDVWYAHADLDELRAQFNTQMKARQRKMVDKGMAKARTRDSMQEVAKLTHLVNGRPKIIADPPLLVPITDLLPAQMDQAAFEAQIQDLLTSTGARWKPRGGPCWSSTRSRTWPARSSASAASAPGTGLSCCSAATKPIRCSCRSKKPGSSVLSRFRGGQQVHQHGPAGRRRAAADAGHQRHLPGLAAQQGRPGQQTP